MTQPFWDPTRLRPEFASAHFDSEGFLRDIRIWTPALANDIGRCLQLTHSDALSPEQQAILLAAREFFERYQRMPTTRAFVKHLGQTLGESYSGSAELMQHFPNYPMRLVALCAGLPKPPNCF